MKKINENTKVTLTFDQLKKLVKESNSRGAEFLGMPDLSAPYDRIYMFLDSDSETATTIGANDPQSLFDEYLRGSGLSMDEVDDYGLNGPDEFAEQIWKMKVGDRVVLPGEVGFYWFRLK